MYDLEKIYNNLCDTPSDINEHLPTLRRYSEQCDTVTEMGIRWVVSTYALLAGLPRSLTSYDIEHPQSFGASINPIYNITKRNNIDFKFIQANTLDIEISNTDLLFIDTLHNYNQLGRELFLHAKNVNKYIILHDTVTFGFVDELPDRLYPTGLVPAVDNFIKSNKEWYRHEVFTNNNGLTILKRGYAENNSCFISG